VPYGSEPHLPVEVGSGVATCPMALELASRLRWAPALPRVLWLRSSPPGLVGSGAVTCPRAPCEPWVSSIKKRLADLPMQLGTHISNARAHVSNAPHVRAVMRLQDVRAYNIVNTCADMHLQCGYSTAIV
jgi:hypothetical protein